MYRFKVGDHVSHVERSNTTGTITSLLTFDEETGERVHEIDENCPWYEIDWNEDEFNGFEHDCCLKPLHS